MRNYTKLIITASSVVSIVLALFIAVNANRYIVRMSNNNSELYDAYRISELMKTFRSDIKELEAKQRGYLITGDGKFLEEYKVKEAAAKTNLKSMEKYFSGKPEEETFYKLKDLTYKKLTEGKDLSHNSGAMNPDGTPKNTDDGIKTLSELNSTIDSIETSLSKTTMVLLDHSVEYEATSKQWSYLEIGIGVLAAVLAAFILFRDVNTRNRLEKELRAAKKQADENAQAKELFMANMSHEIRTPMNAIIGFSDLMQKTRLDRTQLEYMTAIKSSGSNLLNIINDILDFSKIEAGKLKIEKIPFNLDELIQSLQIVFQEKAKEKNISFLVVADDRLPRLLFGDPTRLTQILINLVNNAMKFTSEGQVSLHCEVKNIEHDIAQLVFRVKDTGIGIPEDKQEEIFGRFNQANAETTRKFGGTGLGLSIVKSLVEIQNGTITLKSKEGLGSEFIVTMSFPLAYEEVLAPEVPEELHFGNSSRILLAEDNTLNQKLARTYLESFGLNVTVVENGELALKKLQQENFDLVLMDIQMPVMDGYTTARKIRSELKATLPVIAMTAHILPGEREKCLECGMNDYISKPFREKDLFQLLGKYLGDAVTVKNETAKATAVTIPDGRVVNLEELNQLTRGNDAFLIEMIEIFVQQSSEDITQLTAALAASDFETIRALSHRMKTSLGFMGMRQMIEPLDEMETLAEKKQNLSELSRLFDYVKLCSERAVTELEAELARVKSKSSNPTL